jgi:hypothetical protein
MQEEMKFEGFEYQEIFERLFFMKFKITNK